jgi:ATP-binding cassette, subfamily C, bacterial LapB
MNAYDPSDKAELPPQSAQAWVPKSEFVLGLCLSSLVINVLSLAFPLVLLQIYDRIIPNHAIDTLILLTSAVLAALVLETLLRICRSWVSAWADARLEHTAGCYALHHLLTSDTTEYEQFGAGEHLDRMNALALLKDFYGGQALTTLLDIPFVLLFLGMMAYLGGFLVLLPMFLLCIFVAISFKKGRSLRASLKIQHSILDRRTNFIVDVLSGMHTLKAYGMEALLTRRHERLQEKTAKFNYILTSKHQGISQISILLTQINTVAIVSIGSLLVIHNQFSLGSLAACTLLAGRVLQPLNRAVNVWSRLQTIHIAREQLTAITQIPTEAAPGKVKLATISGDIQLEQVNYAHQQSPTLILHNLNLHVRAGETIAVGGASSSGKSTLLALLGGLISPQSGVVKIDDNDLKTLDKQTYRKYVAYLPQQAILFDGSIMENITMFRGGEYIQKAKAIAQKLGLADIINQMPNGYQTHLIHGAADFLSRGIKQRIAIARALIESPTIILFDEANTALDIIADSTLKDLLLSLKGKATIILVTHRPSLLQLADKRYHLVHGQLTVET